MDTAPAPPRAVTALFFCTALVLLAVYAYTLWTNQNDPGRMFAWIVQFRNLVHGVN